MPIEDGSDGDTLSETDEVSGTDMDTGSDMAAPELDFDAGVDYLSGLGVSVTACGYLGSHRGYPPQLGLLKC